MNVKAIRRRCETLLAALTLPQSRDLAAFCDHVAARRGRPIVLCAVPLAGIAYGACLRGQKADHILYERDTSPFHQQHIILHELSHLLCGHHADIAKSDAVHMGLLDNVDVRRLQTILQRASYSAVEEREAEILATLLERLIGSPRDQGVTPLSERLAASLDDDPAPAAARRGGQA